MEDLICGQGHVYVGEKCDRCGGTAPVKEVEKTGEKVADVDVKSSDEKASVPKTAKKTPKKTPKKTSKKTLKKAKVVKDKKVAKTKKGKK